MKRILWSLAVAGPAASLGCGLTSDACKTIGVPAFAVVVRDARTNAQIEDGVTVIIVDTAVPSRADTLVVAQTDSGPILIARGPGTYELRFQRPGYSSTSITRAVASSAGDCPVGVTQDLSVALIPSQ